MKKVCLFCKNTYNARRSKNMYCSLTCSNRAHLNNSNPVVLPEKSLRLAEFFGILFGDGSVTKYYTKVYLNASADKDYWPYVEALARALFPGATISSLERPARGTHEIQISSRAVCDYLTSVGFDPKKRAVPAWIAKDVAYARHCVRGLFDTEGTVGIKRFSGARGTYVYAQLTFTNRNRNLLKFVETVLQKNSFTPTKKAPKNIYISNTRDVDRYMLEIGSSNPKFARKLALRTTAKIRRGARAV